MQTFTFDVEEIPVVIPFSENKKRIMMYQNGPMTLGRIARVIVGNLKDYVSGLGALNSNQQKYYLFKSYLDGIFDEVDIVPHIKDEYITAIRSLSSQETIVEDYVWKILKVPTQEFAEAIKISRPLIVEQVRKYEIMRGYN